jgi:hypothetical protein
VKGKAARVHRARSRAAPDVARARHHPHRRAARTGLRRRSPPSPTRKRRRGLPQLGFMSLLKKVEQRAAPAESRDYRTVRTRRNSTECSNRSCAAPARLRSTPRRRACSRWRRAGRRVLRLRGRAAGTCRSTSSPRVPEAQARCSRPAPLLEDPASCASARTTSTTRSCCAPHGLRGRAARRSTRWSRASRSHGATRRHNLDDLALTYFGIKKIPTSEADRHGARSRSRWPRCRSRRSRSTPARTRTSRGGCTRSLEKELATRGFEALFYELEMPLVPCSRPWSAWHPPRHEALLEVLGRELDRDIASAEAARARARGTGLNLNSPKALGELLFEKLRSRTRPASSGPSARRRAIRPTTRR